MTKVLILPGLYDSGPDHWQSHWERTLPNVVRIVQRDWERPAREEWVAALEHMVAEHGPDAVLVGHSTACALIAFWAASSSRTAIRPKRAPSSKRRSPATRARSARS